LYIIFGTGHAGVRGLFTATYLDFQTPLGTVETDREFVHRLEEELGEDPAAEELLHANEHVIEFQVIFLQHLFAGRHQFKIVPILASLAPQFLDEGTVFQEERERFNRFCGALREVCRTHDGRVCFIASADLDHIGPRYGDAFMPDDRSVSQALEGDRRLLSLLEKVNMEAFVHEVASDGEAKRICGFSPIAAMLACMDSSSGTLLDLDYAHVDNQNSFVSFASMIFH
jgi:AmmeMemoRadiSam system protein B